MYRYTGIVQLERTLLPQLQRQHSGDRLRHREDPPQRVDLDGLRCFDIALPVRRQVHDLAAPADADQPAGQPPVVDVLAEVGVDSCESLGRHPDIGWVTLDLQRCHGRRRYDECATSSEASQRRAASVRGHVDAGVAHFHVGDGLVGPVRMAGRRDVEQGAGVRDRRW